jgi:threonine aldolase
VIELRSDTFTLPTEEMRAAMAGAPLGDDVYGKDPTVRRLEELAAAAMGKPASCLMPSGTMANLAALLAHVPRGGKAIVGAESDIYVYEGGGASVCGGVVYGPVPNLPDGSLDPDALAAEFPADPDDPQFAPPALICLENSQNRCGGRVLSPSYHKRIAALAAERGVALHLDGARLFNAATALGVPASSLAAHADSVQFCLSKGLSAPIGSMLAGDVPFVDRARRLRKMLGGGMRQAGVVAAAGIVALETMTSRLSEDHATARRLAGGLRQLPGIALDPPDVATNIVMFRVVDDRYTWRSFIAAAADRGVCLAELGHGRIRAVTHRGVTTADVDRALDAIAAVLA